VLCAVKFHEFYSSSWAPVGSNACLYISSATAKLQTVGNHSTAKLEWCLSYEFGISQAETFGRRRKGVWMTVPSTSSLSSPHTGRNPLSQTSYHPPLAKWRVSRTFFRFIVTGDSPRGCAGIVTHRAPRPGLGILLRLNWGRNILCM
jgi:hypothetical protein